MNKELYLIVVLMVVLTQALITTACSVAHIPASQPSYRVPVSTSADSECEGLPNSERIPCYAQTHPRGVR